MVIKLVSIFVGIPTLGPAQKLRMTQVLDYFEIFFIKALCTVVTTLMEMVVNIFDLSFHFYMRTVT